MHLTLSLRQLLTGIVTTIVVAGGVLWAVLSFTIGGMRDDVISIRSTQETAQLASADTLKDANAKETDIRSAISRVVESLARGDERSGALTDGIRELTAQLRDTTTKLANLSDSVSGLDGSVKTIDAKLTTSIQRQENFEQFVLANIIKTTPPVQKSNFEVQQDWNISGSVADFLLSGTKGALLNEWAQDINMKKLEPK